MQTRESDVDLPMKSNRRYCLVSPCRDEADYMVRTLESVTNQSEPPALWVIVDDGSSDDGCKCPKCGKEGKLPKK